MAAAGVDRSVCLGVANTPDRADNTNRFAGALGKERVLGFGPVHPGPSPEENVASLRARGLKGPKVLRLDDPRLLATLDAMSGVFVVIIHVGPQGKTPAARAVTAMLAEIVRLFPRLDVIACHFGGYRRFAEAAEIVVGLPVYLDTSWPSSLGTLDPAAVRSVIEKHGRDRIVFVSDWSMADPGVKIYVVRGLGLSEEDTDAVLGGNLARLLGILVWHSSQEL